MCVFWPPSTFPIGEMSISVPLGHLGFLSLRQQPKYVLIISDFTVLSALYILICLILRPRLGSELYYLKFMDEKMMAHIG
jgi:hypothetical protein